MSAYTWTLNGGEPPTVERLGGKALGLARLAAGEFTIPHWVVLTIEAQNAPQEQVQTELRSVLAAAGLTKARLAVRSSAVAEDAAHASYAGQFVTVLDVPASDEAALWAAVQRVWNSSHGAHAVAYQSRNSPGRVGMAVLLQELIDAEVSGVAFAADPVTGARDVVIIGATPGLGEGLVSGAVDGDLYRVAASPPAILEQRAVADVPVLSDKQILAVAALATTLSARLEAPQDVEWCYGPDAGGANQLWLLQTRPITTLGAKQPDGERRVWDNSNIVESYAGVTTPLTFSFARSVYEEVYLQFCRLMGVEESLLAQHRPVFANMLGLLRGRVYYNLLNWYRALSLLPGYSVNRAFMERMMGVRQKLADPPDSAPVAGPAHDTLRLVRMVGRLGREHRRLPQEIARFHAGVDAALRPLAQEDLTAWSPDRLVALYYQLERDLLRQWRAPLVNDFLAMIYFGVLGRLVEKWLPNAPPSLVNDLLCGEGGILSAEPARRVAALAHQVRETPAALALFADEPGDGALWQRLPHEPGCETIYQELTAYLMRFGERCANELKLETVTLSEDPTPLVGMLRAYVTDPPAESGGSVEAEIRSAAEEQVAAALSGPRHAFFLRVLAGTRTRVRDRENLRFERTRVFGVVRRIFLALGGALAQSGHLASPRDVFSLTREEIFGVVEGTAVTLDLRALVALRQAEFARYTEEPPPPDRFQTFGIPRDGAMTAPTVEPTNVAGELRGVGCCPGRVTAPVRVVRDPNAPGDLRGQILVAERTDPGWTLLFPLARGLLVQRGSLLSHSAIVARETGLPCVVGIAGLLETLRDGDMVEMDGATGVIRLLADGDS
jgi:pyruvate,water dikinase